MNDSDKDGKGDNGKRDSYVQVPRGWSRGLEKDCVFYMSPSNHCLRSKEELIEYLLSNVTCKCGLECPLHLDKIFNFDATLPSRHVKVNECENPEHRTMCKLSMGTRVDSASNEMLVQVEVESADVTDHPVSTSKHIDLPPSEVDVKTPLPTFETFTSPPAQSNVEKEAVKPKKVVNQSKKRKADDIVCSSDGSPPNKIQQCITVHSTNAPIPHSHVKGSVSLSKGTTTLPSVSTTRVTVTNSTQGQSMYGINSILPFPSSHMNASSYLASLSSNVPARTRSNLLQGMENPLRGHKVSHPGATTPLRGNVSQPGATPVRSLSPGQKQPAPVFSAGSSSNVLYLPGVNMISNAMSVKRTNNLQPVSLVKANDAGHPILHQGIPVSRTISTTKVPLDTRWYPPANTISTSSNITTDAGNVKHTSNQSAVISGSINTVTKQPTHQIKDLLSPRSDGTPVNILPLVTTSGKTSSPSSISKASETPGSQPLQYCSILLQPTSNMVPQGTTSPRSTNPAALNLPNADQLAGFNMLPMSSNANNATVLGMSPFLPYVLGIAPNGGTRPVTIQSKMPKSSTSATTESTTGSEDAVAAAYSAFVSIAPAAVTTSMSQHLMNFVTNYSHPYWQQLLSQGTSNPLAYQLLQMNQLASLHASQSGSLKSPKYTSQQQSKHSVTTTTTTAGNYVHSVLGKQASIPHGVNTPVTTSHGAIAPIAPKITSQHPIALSVPSPITVAKLPPSDNILNRSSVQGAVKETSVTTTLTQTSVPHIFSATDHLGPITKSLGKKDVRPTPPGVDFQPQILLDLSGQQTNRHGFTNLLMKNPLAEGTACSTTAKNGNPTQFHTTQPSIARQSSSKTPTTCQPIAPMPATQHSSTHHPSLHQTTIQHPTTRPTTTHQSAAQQTTRELLLRNILSRCSGSTVASVAVDKRNSTEVEKTNRQEAVERIGVKEPSASTNSTEVKLPTSTVDSCFPKFSSGTKSTDGAITKDNKQSDETPGDCEKQRLLKSVTLHYGNTTSLANRTMTDGHMLASDVLRLTVCNYQQSRQDGQKLDSHNERLAESAEHLSRPLRNDDKEVSGTSKDFVGDRTTSLTDTKLALCDEQSLENTRNSEQLQACDKPPESEKGILEQTNTEQVFNTPRENSAGHPEQVSKDCDVTESASDDVAAKVEVGNDPVLETTKQYSDSCSLGDERIPHEKRLSGNEKELKQIHHHHDENKDREQDIEKLCDQQASKSSETGDSNKQNLPENNEKMSDDFTKTEHGVSFSNKTPVRTATAERTKLSEQFPAKDGSESNEGPSVQNTVACDAPLSLESEPSLKGVELLVTHIKEDPLGHSSVSQRHSENLSTLYEKGDEPCSNEEYCQKLSDNIDKDEEIDGEDKNPNDETSIQSDESLLNIKSPEADKISENSNPGQHNTPLSGNFGTSSDVINDKLNATESLSVKHSEHLRVTNSCGTVVITEYIVHNTGIETRSQDENDKTCRSIERTTKSDDVFPNENNDEGNECKVDSKEKEQSNAHGNVMCNGETQQSTSNEIRPIDNTIERDEDFFDPINFTIGDIVWAQARGLPSWPGKIVDEQDVGSGQADDGKRWVMWFGDHTFSQVEIEKLKTLTDGLKTLDENKGKKRKYRGKKSRKGLEQAIGEALEEMEERENPRARQALKPKRRRLRS